MSRRDCASLRSSSSRGTFDPSASLLLMRTSERRKGSDLIADANVGDTATNFGGVSDFFSDLSHRRKWRSAPAAQSGNGSRSVALWIRARDDPGQLPNLTAPCSYPRAFGAVSLFAVIRSFDFGHHHHDRRAQDHEWVRERQIWRDFKGGNRRWRSLAESNRSLHRERVAS